MSEPRSTLSYLKWPLIVTVVGLGLSGWLGWETEGDMGGVISFLFVGTVLAALEIALSFDNAIVNANKLEEMTPVWRQRFLTWGILIAVFGMRIVFPLAIVAIFAWINPFAAMHLALSDPDEYSRIIGHAHGPISAFGGTFLMMVALKFFIDEDKSIDWITMLEKRLRKWGSIRGFEIALVLVIVMVISQYIPGPDLAPFLSSAVMGAFGAILLSIGYRKFSVPSFFDSLIKALEITVLIMFLVAASNFFGAQFSALGTPKMMTELLLGLDMSPYLILILVMSLIFLLGWPLEWVPIVLIVVPILLPTVEALDVYGLDRYDLMVWFGILVAVNLQTAWLSPPVALSAYFLKGVVPNWDLKDIYLGMMQFMLVQLLGLILLFIFPQLVLWLPEVMSGN